MIDAHCHLDFAAFEDDRAERVQKARLAGVRGFVVAGYGPQQWPDQERVQDEHPEARAALGLHPWWVSRCSEAEIEQAVDMLAERASSRIPLVCNRFVEGES